MQMVAWRLVVFMLKLVGKGALGTCREQERPKFGSVWELGVVLWFHIALK